MALASSSSVRSRHRSSSPSGHHRSRLFARLLDPALIGLLIVAAILGGGGVGAGLMNLCVQLAALAVLALRRDQVVAFVRNAPRVLVGLVAAGLLVPLVQSLPLPPVIWQALPGRDLVQQSLALIGAQDSWFPVTVDRNRTVLAFVALLPALAVLSLAWKLDRNRGVQALWLIVGIGLINVLIGVVQLLSSNRSGNFYPGGVGRTLYGFFANHNATGLMLVLALIALAAIPLRERNRREQIIAHGAIGTVLLIATIVTQSRSSMALLLVPLGFLAIRVLGAWRGRPAPVLPVLAAIGLLLGGGYVLQATPKVQQTLSRFSDLDDQRPAIWEDSLFVAGRYWPVGAGVSTFDEVYQVDESLENVEPGRAGRAHNEYLEVAVESGIVGLAILAAWLVWLGWMAWRIARRREDSLALCGVMGLAAIALQSIVDYPLRTQSLLCVAALLIALMVRPTRLDDAAGQGAVPE